MQHRSLHALGPDAPKLSAISSWADFLIFVPNQVAERIPEETLHKFLDRKEIPVDRLTKKGKPKVVDIRPGIRALEWLQELPSDVEGLQTCRPEENLLSMRICLQGDHLTKPEDVLVQLFEGVTATAIAFNVGLAIGVEVSSFG